ncbi:MAG TPA: helix-turn-helix domain-containing protein [Candidatus Thermoplasmatota archaeon]|nr:helix-turn-helix domain-containing protein [Candidatus Thermoplasmatota archaeon]
MKIDDLVTSLSAAGLEEKEARVLVALLRVGASGAAGAADASGLSRPETYRVLESLQARGFVEATLARPRRFQAVAPEKALEILRAERAAALDEVDARRETLLDGLRRLGASPPEAEDAPRFRVLHDDRQVAGQAVRAVAVASREVSFAASSRGLGLLGAEGMPEALAAARGRGARVRVVAEIVEGNADAARAAAALAEVRHAPVARGVRFLVADDSLLGFVTADPIGAAAETALWTGPSDLVAAQRSHFEELWRRAVPLEARLEEIATGRAPPSAELIEGRVYRIERVKGMAFRAERSLDLALPFRDVKDLSALLADRAAEGLTVRVLVPPGFARSAVPAGCACREWARAPASLFAIADERELLLVLAEGEGVDAADSNARAVWSALPGAPEGFARKFERLWAEAKPL